MRVSGALRSKSGVHPWGSGGVLLRVEVIGFVGFPRF